MGARIVTEYGLAELIELRKQLNCEEAAYQLVDRVSVSVPLDEKVKGWLIGYYQFEVDGQAYAFAALRASVNIPTSGEPTVLLLLRSDVIPLFSLDKVQDYPFPKDKDRMDEDWEQLSQLQDPDMEDIVIYQLKSEGEVKPGDLLVLNPDGTVSPLRKGKK